MGADFNCPRVTDDWFPGCAAGDVHAFHQQILSELIHLSAANVKTLAAACLLCQQKYATNLTVDKAL
jgi:hypothetical protein